MVCVRIACPPALLCTPSVAKLPSPASHRSTSITAQQLSATTPAYPAPPHLMPPHQPGQQLGHSSSRQHQHQHQHETAPLLQPPVQQRAATAVTVQPSSEAAAEQQLGTCRICLESETAESQDPRNPLISPCRCSGGSKFVHRQCLAQWRETNHRADAFHECEVCKYRYRYTRLWWAGLLGSRVTVLMLYTLLMGGLIAGLGFVPVTRVLFSRGAASSPTPAPGSSPAPAPAPSPAPGPPPQQPLWLAVAGHIVNGLIMMGLVGLVGSGVLGLLRACGYTGLFFLPDAFCPSCLWCLDVSGGPGIGWAPFVECGGAAGECGVALFALLVVAALTVGLAAAAYMLYAGLWALVQHGLERAQQMVENVQQQDEGEGGNKPASAVR